MSATRGRQQGTLQPCSVCGGRARPQCVFCHACEKRVSRHLTNQAAYAEDLELELTRQVRKQPVSEGGRSTGSPIVFSPEAGEVIAEQRKVLARWVAFVTRLLPARPAGPTCRACAHPTCKAIRHLVPPTAAVVSQANFIRVHLSKVRRHPDGAQLVHDVQQLVNAIIKIIDSPENLTRIHVGPCPNDWPDDEGHELPCPGDVSAVVPADERVPAMMSCSACRQEWDTTQWTRTGRRIRARHEQQQKQRQLAAEFVRRGA